MGLSQRQVAQLEDLRSEFAQRHGRVLASVEGKELLAYLSRKFFDGDLIGDTPEETAFNLGAREVVRVMRMISAGLDPKERKP